MYISQLTMRNFRNFKNTNFKFKKGVNTLIGENGSGKTNVFYALRLLIDDSLPIRARVLEETDFNRSIGNWKGHWIIIYVEFEELDSSEEAGILACHATQNVNDCKKGTYAMYFRPKKPVRQKLYEISELTKNKKSELNKLLSEITIDDYETVFPCRGEADFSDDNIYKKYIGDFEKIIFPNPEELAEDQLGCPSPTIFSFSKSVSCTFIKALRDVMADLKNSRSNPLIHLLRGSEKQIEINKAKDIIVKVSELNEEISNLDEIKKISNGTRKVLQDAVGKTYAPSLDIKSELPNDIEKLLNSLTLWVGDPSDGDYQGKIEELSLGGANIIFLSLKLLEYDLKQSTDKLGHFLLIEEPEAHIHTHIQKTLFSKMESKSTQVIISTHSTHISDASKISTVNILCKERQETRVYQPSNGLENEQIRRIERYLDAVRSTLLFAKGIILVEGDAELIVIPALVKAVFGVSLDEIGVSLINMSSTVFEHIAIIFDEERIRRKCAIITDSDSSIIELSANSKNDNEFEKKCRNSEISGLQRKQKLEIFCKDNDWVKPFYAPHTFEVDFLSNGNSFEVKSCLQNIYSKKIDIEKSSKALESKNIEICGKEVLRLAEKVGKGWLALIISEQLFYRTYIPKYILKAIAFAISQHISDDILAHIARYRLLQDQQTKGNPEFNKVSIELKMLMDSPQKTKEFLLKFLSTYPDDQLSQLIEYLRGENSVK